MTMSSSNGFQSSRIALVARAVFSIAGGKNAPNSVFAWRETSIQTPGFQNLGFCVLVSPGIAIARDLCIIAGWKHASLLASAVALSVKNK